MRLPESSAPEVQFDIYSIKSQISGLERTAINILDKHQS